MDIDDNQTLEPKLERFDIIISINGEGLSNLKSSKPKKIIGLLRQSLGDRVLHVATIDKCKKKLTFGLVLDPVHMLEKITKGPPGDSQLAKEFREFWGDKSVLRRFQDEGIHESVYWDSPTIADKRAIVGKIIKFIFSKHLSINRRYVTVFGSQLDSVLLPSKTPIPGYGTGEENNLKIVSNFDSLAKKLRSLKDLPLVISSVQGVSSAFRGAEVFPLDLVPPIYHERIYGNRENCVTFLENTDKISLKHIKPIDVLIHLETSGKWPSNLEALKRVKAAYIIELCETINNQFGLICKPQKRYFDIWQESMVFRIHLACAKEIHLMRHTITSEGSIKTIESFEADELTKFHLHLPTITSVLQNVKSRFTTFSAVVRIVKCWISRHLLWDNVDEIAIELIVAHLYLHPFPYSAPMSPLTGFIRFLSLLISFSWNKEPLIVNFNDELKLDDIQGIKLYFKENREKLPPIFIATPYDKEISFWTRSKISKPIFQRLIFLSKKCYEYIQMCLNNPTKACFMPVFRTSTEIYDLTIHLNKNLIPNFNLNLNFIRHAVINNKEILSFQRRKNNRKVEHFPIVDFNPVDCYLKDLRKHFGHYALFFYDRFGGNKIYLIWKPHTFDMKPLYLVNVNDCKLTETTIKSGKSNVIFNAEAVMEDLYILGDGLVTSIDANVSKWE